MITTTRPTITVRLDTREDDWRNQAACVGCDPELWFPNKRDPDSAEQTIAICQQCPVRLECLDFAMDTEGTHHRYGIYGGLEANQRVSLYNTRARRARREAARAAA